MSERLGIFGGTFDPIHIGHLFVANAVLADAKLDQVLFLPVGAPAHRETHALASDRKEMVRLAIASNQHFRLDETALHQEGPVYTADTMPLLRHAYPHAAFTFIAGADSLIDSPWRRLDEVVSALQRFYVVAREGTNLNHLAPTLSTLAPELAGRFTLVNLPFVDVSSTIVRERVACGKPVRYLVPDTVEDYIRKNNLYAG